MKIVRDDAVLHVVRRPQAPHMILYLILLITLLADLVDDWLVRETNGRIAWHVLCLLVPLFAFLGYLSPRDYEFDKATRKLTWRRRWLWWAQGGELPFADITDTVVEVEEEKIFWRKREACALILRTKGEDIAIYAVYSRNARTRCEEIAARIRAVLRNPKA